MLAPLAFVSMPGPFEMMIILGIGVLLFGKRLPEVGRSLGKGIIEFKKGLQGIEDEFTAAVNSTASTTTASTRATTKADDYEEATAPKFEPPSNEPMG